MEDLISKGFPSEFSGCVTPQRKRTWTPASVTNALSSKKKRRVSSVSIDFTDDITPIIDHPVVPSPTHQSDRFISERPEFASLTTTPRTNRIARVFGLIDEKVLKYHEPLSASHSNNPFIDIRANFSQLLSAPRNVSPTSSTSHLGKRQQFLLALDGPGVPTDPFAYPLTWSSNGTNTIAVACKKDVYFQDLDTRAITHLCKLKAQSHGRPMSIEWCFDQPRHLGVGTSSGSVQVWDSIQKEIIQEWMDKDSEPVGGMSWKGSLLAVGVDGGGLGFYDTREKEAVGRLTLHKMKVLGCKWSTDGNYLASSDGRGIVYVWDARGGKVLTHSERMGGKMKHNAPVKALAWCPWKPDLLATGSTYPDGKIRIFSIKTTTSIPQPINTVSLHTSITSLQWSPHCKELLSTHGTSWNPLSLRSTIARPVPAKSPLMNSITVHSYPSLRRIVSVTAHAGAVGHSCLGPDGTMCFTVCPAEEAMKMWKVWGIQDKKPKEESVFDKYGIR